MTGATSPEAAAAWLEQRAPPLREDEIHVWHLPLGDDPVPPRELERVLDADERARAKRFRFARDTSRYVVLHAALRILVAGYLGCRAQEVRLARGRYGKPVVGDPECDLRFNVTDSGGLGLAAFAWGRELGIDLEHDRTDVDALALARHFFTPREAMQLAALAADVRTRAFLECWTRKEAYAKARGEGLNLPLDSFEVSIGAVAEPRLVRVRDRPTDVARFALLSPPVPHPYVAALVLERRAPGEQFVLDSAAAVAALSTYVAAKPLSGATPAVASG